MEAERVAWRSPRYPLHGCCVLEAEPRPFVEFIIQSVEKNVDSNNSAPNAMFSSGLDRNQLSRDPAWAIMDEAFEVPISIKIARRGEGGRNPPRGAHAGALVLYRPEYQHAYR